MREFSPSVNELQTKRKNDYNIASHGGKMINFLNYIASWFGYTILPLEASEENKEHIAVAREHLEHLEALDTEYKKNGYRDFEEFRKFIENGECRYALLAMKGDNKGEYWPIDVTALTEGNIHLAAVPDEWRPYIEHIKHAPGIVLPLFLAQRVGSTEDGIRAAGIHTPTTIDPVPSMKLTK